MSTLVYSFTSHIMGKNARVRVYTTHVEWDKPRGVSGAKVAAGLMTGGLSMLATGVKNGKAGTEMIPIEKISSIVTKRDGLLNSIVQFITSGNTLDMRVSHSEAAQVKDVVQRLMLGQHVDPVNPGQLVAPTAQPATPSAARLATLPPPPAAQVPVVAAAPSPEAPSQPDVMAQLQQLGSLRDAGILTAEEFEAKKAQLLDRI